MEDRCMASKLKELAGMPMKGTPYFDDSRWVSPQNFETNASFDTMPKRVSIHDVTLRDGEQTCGLVWREDDRVRIGEALNELGVDRIEVGMPIISEENRRAIKRLKQMNLNSEIVAFCRAMPKDLDAALEVGVDRIIVEHAVNPYLNTYVYHSSMEEVVEKVSTCINYVRKNGVKVSFMGWDATRSSLDYVLETFSRIAKKAEPETMAFVDSFGVGTPPAIQFAFEELRKAIPEKIGLEFHVHNEFGLAMGSVIAAIIGGARTIHSSMNGLGERTGNVATEQVAAALKILLNIDTGVDISKLWDVSRLVQDIAKISPAYNNPVVGEKLFWVESGVVVDALDKLNKAGIKAAMTPYLPQLVGRPGPEIKYGAFSGNASVKYYLKQRRIEATEAQLEEILERIHVEGRIRKTVLDESFIAQVVASVIGKA
jgi:methanogen homocitrate synthase